LAHSTRDHSMKKEGVFSYRVCKQNHPSISLDYSVWTVDLGIKFRIDTNLTKINPGSRRKIIVFSRTLRSYSYLYRVWASASRFWANVWSSLIRFRKRRFAFSGVPSVPVAEFSSERGGGVLKNVTGSRSRLHLSFPHIDVPRIHGHVTHITIRDGTIAPRVPLPSLIYNEHARPLVTNSSSPA
jgi:hypothetical protein